MTQISEISARAIAFWRAAGSKAWFTKSDAFDAQIKAEFGTDIEFLTTVNLEEYFANETDAHKILGIIICLDQFRRNLYRNSGKAFAQDNVAFALAKILVYNQLDQNIDKDLRMFAHMPYMHSEDLSVQEKALILFNNSEFAVIHYDLIKQYGRFPHRNEVLGRTSTAQELTFLQTDGFKG